MTAGFCAPSTSALMLNGPQIVLAEPNAMTTVIRPRSTTGGTTDGSGAENSTMCARICLLSWPRLMTALLFELKTFCDF
jgi:hypothetical protein